MRVLAILLLMPAVALAQQGARPAAGLLTERVLPLDMAVDMARGAIDKCRVDGTIALGGGFPIRAGDQVVGAIGVSGAPGQDKDEACANAGLAAVAARLK